MATTRLRTAGAIGVAAVLLAACGGGVKGTPVAELWDPCTVSESELRVLGLEPSYNDPATQTDGLSTWRSCTFEDPVGFVTIYSTGRSYESLRGSEVAASASAVALPPATAVQYVDSSEPACLTLIERSFGATLVKAARRSDSMARPNDAGMCLRSFGVARAILPSIPS